MTTVVFTAPGTIIYTVPVSSLTYAAVIASGGAGRNYITGYSDGGNGGGFASATGTITLRDSLHRLYLNINSGATLLGNYSNYYYLKGYGRIGSTNNFGGTPTTFNGGFGGTSYIAGTVSAGGGGGAGGKNGNGGAGENGSALGSTGVGGAGDTSSLASIGGKAGSHTAAATAGGAGVSMGTIGGGGGAGGGGTLFPNGAKGGSYGAGGGAAIGTLGGVGGAYGGGVAVIKFSGGPPPVTTRGSTLSMMGVG